MHYLPLAPGFFAILIGFFLLVLILRSVRYAYESWTRLFNIIANAPNAAA